MTSASPFEISRSLARLDARLEAFRAAPHAVAKTFDPFSGRLFPGKSSFDEVLGLPVDDPLRLPLASHIAHLVEARVCLPELLYEKGLRDEERLVVSGWDRDTTLSELAPRLLSSQGERRAEIFGVRLRLGARLGAHRFVLLEKRREVRRRLGVGNLRELSFPAFDSERLLSLAGEILAAGHERAFGQSPLAWFESSLALGAEAGWPARLTARTTIELSGLAGRLERERLPEWRVPARLSPSSFLLALSRLGAAVAQSRARQPYPFVVIESPGRVRAASIAFLFSLLPLTGAFRSRKLGLGRDESQRVFRVLRRALLRECERLACGMSILIRGSKAEANEAFREWSARKFGEPLSLEEYAGLAFRDEPAEGLLAALLGMRLFERYRDTYDDDFFENPRFHEQLLEELALPESRRVEASGLDAGHRVFLELLGDLGS